MSHSEDIAAAAAPGEKPKKKGMHGCLIALLVAAGLGLVTCGGVVFLGNRFLQSEAGQAVLESTNTMIEAQKGPIPEALKAKGCGQVMVFPVEKMKASLAKIDPHQQWDGKAQIAVACNDPPRSLACEEVAAAAATAGKLAADGVLEVVIDQQGQARCSGEYDATGKRIGDAKGVLQARYNKN